MSWLNDIFNYEDIFSHLEVSEKISIIIFLTFLGVLVLCCLVIGLR